MSERTNRLANHLVAAGLGVHTERGGLGGHESGQDHLACYLHNGNEYLEAMLGAYKARVAPFNVNYRYVTEELRYLLNDAGARAIVFHSAFAARLAEVLPDLPALTVLLQVDDDSGNDLLPGAQWYEDALAAASADAARRGAAVPTTSTSSTPAAPPGCPRACCGARPTSTSAPSGGRNLGTGAEWASVDEVVEGARTAGDAPAARAAVHARGRALAGPQRHERRQHDLHPGRHGRARPRRHLAHHRARARSTSC